MKIEDRIAMKFINPLTDVGFKIIVKMLNREYPNYKLIK